MDITDYIINSEEDELRYLRVAKTLIDLGANPSVKACNGMSLVEYFLEIHYPHLHRIFANAIS